jgi:hypothetical protein
MMSFFSQIVFEPHPIGEGKHGKLFLPNGYGISVVRFKIPGLTGYGSYCNGNTWEVAILKGTQDNFELCYDTEFTNDVLGFQTEDDINNILGKLRRIH